MLIDVDKIVVNDRIRKDFGDLEELADDIRQNTLLNAIVVTPNSNGTYTLIAGERRLMAVRDILGYKAVTVNVVAADDSEHALLMEISENECRKEFTKTERLDYARRLARIEAAKSQQGKRSDLAQDVVQSERNRTANAVAQTLGTNRETLRQEQFIEEHRDMVSIDDFADWDEGKLSTNKVYQRIKAAQVQAEHERDAALAEVETVRAVGDKLKRERDEAREDAEGYGEDIRELQDEIAALEKQSDKAYEDGYKAAEANLGQQPRVVERTVEVVPDDYASIKHERDLYLSDLQRMRKSNEELRGELDRAKDLLSMDKTMQDVRRDVQYLTDATNGYVRRYGGLTWTAASFEQVDAQSIDALRTAAINLATFANALVASLESISE